jgi:uncharacterized protein YbaA (DUF1428 family)
LISTFQFGINQQEELMAYVQGFVLPVPADRKEAYRKAAAAFSPIVREFGATR